MRNKAFTLAEVLVTLVMIGVVAALTIPSLINNIGDQQNKTAYRKAFADLSQVTMKIAADNGGSLSGLFSSHNTFKDSYLPYLNYIKTCNTDTSLGSCWHKNDGSAKYLDGTGITGWGNPAAIILNNGTFLYFWFSSTSCTNNAYNILRCGELTLDVNGFRGPNTIGKDIFNLHVTENTIKPWGVQGDIFSTNSSHNCTSTGTGHACSALYLYQ